MAHMSTMKVSTHFPWHSVSAGMMFPGMPDLGDSIVIRLAIPHVRPFQDTLVSIESRMKPDETSEAETVKPYKTIGTEMRTTDRYSNASPART